MKIFSLIGYPIIYIYIYICVCVCVCVCDDLRITLFNSAMISRYCKRIELNKSYHPSEFSKQNEFNCVSSHSTGSIIQLELCPVRIDRVIYNID
jgi:hypothetical protein